MAVAMEIKAFSEEESDEFVPRIIGLDDTHIDLGDEIEKVLLFYVNEDAFNNVDSVTNILQNALDEKINIVMVHEQDSKRGACEFGDAVKQTPVCLVDRGLYDILAVPLHGLNEYRKISLRQVLIKMGATPKESQVIRQLRVMRISLLRVMRATIQGSFLTCKSLYQWCVAHIL